jgi:hypothetical protein
MLYSQLFPVITVTKKEIREKGTERERERERERGGERERERGALTAIALLNRGVSTSLLQ